jgi:hypothetical protein
VDSAGRTWSLTGNAAINNRKVRFVGEVASWTPRWDTGGKNVTADVEAAGVLRRLGAGQVPVKSPFYREFTSAGRRAAGIVAYWPMEDESGAATLASAYSGHPSAAISGTVTPASYTGWVASDAIPTITTGLIRVPVPTYTVTANAVVGFFARVPAAGVVSTQRLMSMSLSGSSPTWSVYVNTSGNLAVRAVGGDGTMSHDSGFGTDSINGLDKYIILQLTQSGFNINYVLSVVDIAATLPTAIPKNTYTNFTISGTLLSNTFGRITQVQFGEDGAMNGTAIGHVAIGNASSAFTASIGVMVGWNAETGSSRVARLGSEEGVRAYALRVGDEQCGPQPRATILDILRGAADVDEGILTEQRTILGLRHVSRAAMYNQVTALTLNYRGDDGLVAPLDPVDDDQSVTNDVTVVRSGGTSARTTLDTGRLSTQAPPSGVGLYDTSYTLGLLDDTQPQNHAGWRLFLGTWDETRYPQVTVNLAGAPSSIEAAAAVDVGSRIQITNPPAWLPPDTIDLRVEGYTETLDQFTWTLVYNCSPAGPWSVGVVEDTTLGRVDTDGSQLAQAATSTDTALTVQTTTGPVWITSAVFGSEFPFDVKVGGEGMRVTAVANAVSDAFGRTLSGSWGSTDSGQAWSNSGGVASNFNVGSGYGSHVQSTVNATRRSVVTSPSADTDLYVDVAASALATGASLSGGPITRSPDGSNFYQVRLDFTTGGTITLTLLRRAAGTDTTLVTVTSAASYTAGQFFRVRMQTIGSLVQAKLWAASASEPDTWTASATDTSLTAAAQLGVRSFAFTGNTNTNPELRYDNFQIVNPQAFTVARGLNGISKAQTAGTAVSLANPTIVAL